VKKLKVEMWEEEDYIMDIGSYSEDSCNISINDENNLGVAPH